MTKRELTAFIIKTSVEKLKNLLQGLDLMNNGGLLNDITEDEINLLISLRDVERSFRVIASLKIKKSELDAERQDLIRRNVPTARWGK